MPTYSLTPIDTIIINRDTRQRRDLKDIESLAHSIQANGLIQPIVLNGSELMAGERRLTAAKTLGWDSIPSIQFTDLNPAQAKIIELEENMRRKDLDWRDRARAFGDIFDALKEIEGESFTQIQMAERLGLTPNHVSKMLVLAKEITQRPQGAVANFASMQTAYNALNRQTSRAAEAELEHLLHGTSESKSSPAPESEAEAESESDPESELSPNSYSTPGPRKSSRASQYEIRQENFLSWAQAYSGPRFNFIHCDFPYGINHHKSELGYGQSWGTYDDTIDIYDNLLNCLARHQESLISTSAHVIFWFPVSRISQTLSELEKLFPTFDWNPVPLIWHKKDNTGILPAPHHGPRQIYEMAYFGYSNGRKVCQPVANLISIKGRDSSFIHQSQKALPVLEHFFRMTVDSSTRMLDPTCGSGSSIQAAASHEAKSALGLELDPDMARSADYRLQAYLRGDVE